MQIARPSFAMDPKRFGKGAVRDLASGRSTAATLSDDLRLFVTTFLAGFVFVSILIG